MGYMCAGTLQYDKRLEVNVIHGKRILRKWIECESLLHNVHILTTFHQLQELGMVINQGLVRNAVFTENSKRYMWIMVRFPQRKDIFLFTETSHLASIQRAHMHLSTREKRPRREDDHCLLPKLRMSEG